MFNPISAWFDAARLATDSQRVITLRMMQFAVGGPKAKAEASLMISEKMAAFGEAQGRFAAAIAGGRGVEVATRRAMVPIRRTVRANGRRLGR